MHKMTQGLKDICGEHFLEEVASGLTLGVLSTIERLFMGRNAPVDLLSPLCESN